MVFKNILAEFVATRQFDTKPWKPVLTIPAVPFDVERFTPVEPIQI